MVGFQQAGGGVDVNHSSGESSVSPKGVENIENEPAHDGQEVNEGEGEEDAEEGEEVKVNRAPGEPSRAEREKHAITHMPFRSWCKHCVEGKAVNPGHYKKKEGEEQRIPVVSIDYMYMTEENQGEMGMPILVFRDRESKWITANVVPAKGENGYAIKRLAQDVEYLGYKRIILKSDEENPIMALKRAVRRERTNDIMLEESPVGESQSNGEIEREPSKQCEGK